MPREDAASLLRRHPIPRALPMLGQYDTPRVGRPMLIGCASTLRADKEGEQCVKRKERREREREGERAKKAMMVLLL